MAGWITGNYYLNQTQMENNATLIWAYFKAKGWSMNGVAGMLGNMQTESTINPGIWQDLIPDRENMGYGLVQWTPMTKYRDWAGTYWANNGPLQCDRIIWELENGEQWIKTSTYPITFAEFSVSTDNPYNLGMAFLYNYERPGDLDQPNRGRQAQEWFDYLGGVVPPPEPTEIRKLPIWMYGRIF